MTTLTSQPTDDAVKDSTSPNTPARFAATLKEVCSKIAPVWPLEDYVAINPYSGYAAEFHDKKVSKEHIAEAIKQLQATVDEQCVLPGIGDIVFTLQQAWREGRVIVEFGTQNESPEGDWGTEIIEEISRHCSAHYDRSQSVWKSPFKDLSLYDAWRETMRRDRKSDPSGAWQATPRSSLVLGR